MRCHRLPSLSRSSRVPRRKPIPRPSIPAGPLNDLMGLLHDLYDEAGWPSTRTLAKDSGYSHPTIGSVLKSTDLPYWPYVVRLTKRLVEVANADGATHDVDDLLRKILNLYRLAS